MLRTLGLVCFALAMTARAQMSPKTVSVDDAIASALSNSSLTDHGSPFHAVLSISKPTNTTSSYNGTVELFWSDPQNFRLIITSPGFKQVRTVQGSRVEEHDTGDYYPGWLRAYVTALVAPIPRPELFLQRGGRVMVGPAMTTCLRRDDRPGGITDQLTWAQLCLKGDPPLLDYYIDFSYSAELDDFKPFGTKSIAHTYKTYIDGHDPVVGKLTVLEPLRAADKALLDVTSETPAAQRIETTFVSTLKEESMVETTDTSQWPPVRDGKTEGYMIVYAVTDRTGQVREAHKHNSDNAELEDAGVARALHYKFKPLIMDGIARQMEMPLVLHFTSRIEDARPVITDSEIPRFVSGCETPVLPKGLVPKGTPFHIRFLIGEQGKVYEEYFMEANSTNPKIPNELSGPAWGSLRSCGFKPYLRGGKPTEYFVLFSFIAP